MFVVCFAPIPIEFLLAFLQLPLDSVLELYISSSFQSVSGDAEALAVFRESASFDSASASASASAVSMDMDDSNPGSINCAIASLILVNRIEAKCS